MLSIIYAKISLYAEHHDANYLGARRIPTFLG
jgi:hypothetical protein